MHFFMEQTLDGRVLKILVLAEAMLEHGVSVHLRWNNGPEMVAKNCVAG